MPLAIVVPQPVEAQLLLYATVPSFTTLVPTALLSRQDFNAMRAHGRCRSGLCVSLDRQRDGADNERMNLTVRPVTRLAGLLPERDSHGQRARRAPVSARRLCAALSAQHSGLTRLHLQCILVCMRTTLNLNDDLLSKAAHLTGVREKTALIHLGLEALIARESARRLAQLGGSQKRLRPIPRRRSGAA